MRRKPQLITKDVALTVECPDCHAAPGVQCSDGWGAKAPVHVERYLVVDRDNRLTQMSMAALLDDQATAEVGLGL